jgi:glucose/arabinose dehydrogenase
MRTATSFSDPPAVTSCATSAVARPTGPAGQSVFLANVHFPTAIAWAPDGRLFIAERAGTIETDARGRLRTFATVPTVTTEPGGGYSERGLLGLAVSPNFVTDRFVYALYSTTDREHTVIVRWTDCRGVGTYERTLITLPAGPDCCHKGGRLDFGPDGKLYVTIGDEHSVPAPPGGPKPPNPQNVADPRGKVLRYNPDGSVPADNPFGAKDPVWVAGLRNPFGIAFGPRGQLFVTVNGPTGDAGSPPTGYDVFFFARRGAVYQWPYCYGYSHPIPPYTGCHGRAGPDWSSERTTDVPTGATWVDTQGPAALAGHFVFCSDFQGMFIVSAGSPHATVSPGPAQCHLDVKQGPDHAVYFSDETTIYRLS